VTTVEAADKSDPTPAETLAARRRRGSSVRSRVGAAIPAVILFAALLGVWELVIVVTNQPDYILPPFWQVASSAVDQSDILLPALWVTLKEVVLGFIVAVVVGMALAIGIVHSRTVERAVLPVVIASQAIPVIAIAPVLLIWFGFGMTSKVIMGAIVAFFPVVINATAGLTSVENDSLALMRSLSASRRDIFFKLRLPGAMPLIFAGLKNAAVISVIGAIVGEWVGATEGLGPVMMAANASYQTPLVFAAILYLAVVGVSFFLAVSLAERVVLRWHFVTRSRAAQG
jgi:ABC-type nitrate/sulfonate/bicarbonate transport system permease component